MANVKKFNSGTESVWKGIVDGTNQSLTESDFSSALVFLDDTADGTRISAKGMYFSSLADLNNGKEVTDKQLDLIGLVKLNPASENLKHWQLYHKANPNRKDTEQTIITDDRIYGRPTPTLVYSATELDSAGHVGAANLFAIPDSKVTNVDYHYVPNGYGVEKDGEGNYIASTTFSDKNFSIVANNETQSTPEDEDINIQSPVLNIGGNYLVDDDNYSKVIDTWSSSKQVPDWVTAITNLKLDGAHHVIGANVTMLPTISALTSAIAKLTSALQYIGAISFTTEEGLSNSIKSAITANTKFTTLRQGYVFIYTGEKTTIDNVEYENGDMFIYKGDEQNVNSISVSLSDFDIVNTNWQVDDKTLSTNPITWNTRLVKEWNDDDKDFTTQPEGYAAQVAWTNDILATVGGENITLNVNVPVMSLNSETGSVTTEYHDVISSDTENLNGNAAVLLGVLRIGGASHKLYGAASNYNGIAGIGVGKLNIGHASEEINIEIDTNKYQGTVTRAKITTTNIEENNIPNFILNSATEGIEKSPSSVDVDTIMSDFGKGTGYSEGSETTSIAHIDIDKYGHVIGYRKSVSSDTHILSHALDQAKHYLVFQTNAADGSNTFWGETQTDPQICVYKGAVNTLIEPTDAAGYRMADERGSLMHVYAFADEWETLS